MGVNGGGGEGKVIEGQEWHKEHYWDTWQIFNMNWTLDNSIISMLNFFN